jgi:hypothetical protein
MQLIQQQVIEALQALSSTEQQEVLDFAEFLKSKRQAPQPEPDKQMSALELAGDLVGCLKAEPSDLSTNKQYMEGFGQE